MYIFRAPNFTAKFVFFPLILLKQEGGFTNNQSCAKETFDNISSAHELIWDVAKITSSSAEPKVLYFLIFTADEIALWKPEVSKLICQQVSYLSLGKKSFYKTLL